MQFPQVTVETSLVVKPKKQDNQMNIIIFLRESKMQAFREESHLSVNNPKGNNSNPHANAVFWNEIKFKNPTPSCRTQAAGFSAAKKYYNEYFQLIFVIRICIYGGIDVTGKEAATDEIWIINPFNEEPEWKSYRIHNHNMDLPSKKFIISVNYYQLLDGISRHTITQVMYDNSESAIVIGGQRNFSINEKINYQNQQNQLMRLKNQQIKPYKRPGICMFISLQDLDKIQSRELPIIPETSEAYITEIDSHTATFIPNKQSIIVFGGYINQSTLSNNLYQLSLSNNHWSLLKVNSRSPFPRSEHGVAYNDKGDQIYMFGGKSGHLGDRLQDFWVLDIEKLVWTEVQLKFNSLKTQPRSGHGMVFDGHSKIYIFGGRGDDSVVQELNDLWYFNMQNKQFIQVHASQTADDPQREISSPATALKLTKMIKNLNKNSPIDSPLTKYQNRQYSNNDSSGLKLQKERSVSGFGIKIQAMNNQSSDIEVTTENQQLKTAYKSNRLPIEENIVRIRKISLKKGIAHHQKFHPFTIRKSQQNVPQEISNINKSITSNTFRDSQNFPKYIMERLQQMKMQERQNYYDNYYQMRKVNHSMLEKGNDYSLDTSLMAPQINFSDLPKKEQIESSTNILLEQKHKKQNFSLSFYNSNQNQGIESYKTSLQNPRSSIQHNPNQSWDSREAMSFRSRGEMISQKGQYEKRLEKIKGSHIRHSSQQNEKAPNITLRTSINAGEEFSLSPVSMNMKNTFIFSVVEQKRERFMNKKIQQQPIKVEKGIISGSRPCQRDGCVFLLMKDKENQKYLMVFGGDRFRRAFNDLYYFKITNM